MKLNELTIKQAQERLEKGEITSVELTKTCLARIKKVNEKLNAVLTVCEKEALEWAEEADKKRKKGEKGDLLGIPYLAKDNIMTRGVCTTVASKILENYVSPYDATVIKKLKKAGAVLLGKVNLDEFAHGASTENSVFGPTHNPWDLTRVPGGSSGGSAAAAAADMCLFALGTDTGGSIRHPASFCGVTGLKPTYGRASRFGLIAMTSSTDVPGPLTKTVEDASLVLKIISGQDESDATTPEVKVDKYSQDLNKNIKGLKIGLPQECFNSDLDPDIKKVISKAIENLKELGADFIDVNLPHTKYGVAVYYIITPSEISSNLARFDGIKYGFSESEAKNLQEVYTKTRGKGFGAETKRRIMIGTYALSAGYFDAYYLQAQKVRTKIREEIDEALKKVDCLLTPTASGVAFKIGEKTEDPLKMYLEDIFVTGPSLAGLPALSIPAGFIQGLPVGMQLIGKRFDENTLFRVGYNFQKETDFHTKKPKL